MVQAYLILNNIGKRGNFGTLIRSAAAMGIQDIFVVGAEKLRTFGNQNTLSKCRLHYWNTLVELKEFLQSRDIKVVGIEIDDKSTALTETDFTNQDIAFMLGNEGTGMNAKQKQICDSFVYIEHFSGATASLNVAVAGGIVFHRYAIQNSKATQKRDGQKYVVQESVAEFEDLSQPNRGREYHRHDPADLSDLDLSFGGLERNEDYGIWSDYPAHALNMPPAAPPPPVNVAYLDGTVYNNPKRYKDNLGGPNGFKPKKDPIPGPPIPVAAGKPVFDIVVEPEYVPDPFPVPYPYPVEEDYDDNLYLTSGDGDNDHDRPPADQGDPLPSQSPGGRRKKPKYKRTNYIERSEPEWSCPREYTEEGRRCVQFDVVDVEIGCVDGWEYRNGECIAIDIQLPEMVCPEEFEKIGDRCTRSIIAPKQMICPENQIHTIHGCKQNVVAEPAIQCIGSTMSQGVCQRTIRMRPDPQCTLGFKLGGDERTCFKESVTSGQTTCLDQFSFDEHGMCERMVVGDVLATCPHGYTRDNFTCHRKVVHPALRTCDFGLMSEDGTCLSTKSLGRPMAACPHGAVLNAYMKCEATAKHPISKSKKKKEACDTGFKQTGDECVKTLFMEPSYSCDGGATLVGSECVSTISSAVLLSCLPGQTLDGDACYYDEATTTSTSCAPGFDLTLDGKCLKREVTNPQLACPQGYRPGVDAMCHQIEKIEATLNCPVTTSLILEDDTYICHGIETVQPDYTCPIPGLALETTATGPKCTGWQVNEPTFVCAPGFTNEGNKCVKLEAASKLPVCPAEYSLSFDSCLRELQQPALYFCPDGYVHQRKAQTCTRKKYTDLIPVCPTDMEYDKLVGECYRLKTDYEFDEPLKTGGDPPDEALKDLDVTTPSPSTEETTLAPAAEGPMGGYPPLPPMAGYPPIGHHHLAAALPPPQLTIVQQPVVVPQPAVILPQQAPVPPPPAIRVPYGVPQPVPTPVRPLEHHKVINQSMSTVINPSMYGSAGGKKHA